MNKVIDVLLSCVIGFPLSLYITIKYHDEILEEMREQAYRNTITHFDNERLFRHPVK